MDILVNIDVKELDEGIAFYEKAWDLRLSRKLMNNAVAELTGASSRVYLLEKAPGTPAIPDQHGRDYSRHWTPVHVDLVVEDIILAAERAKGAGATQETAIEDLPWGRLASFSDPFGNGFCFVEFPGAPYEGAEDRA